MLQSFPPNVATWNRTQIKHWLSLKGFSIEIQNKFYDETIDGEALLYLKEDDINTLTSTTSITFGKKLKLKRYIAQLQSNSNDTLLSSLSPTHKLLRIDNIHSSPITILKHSPKHESVAHSVPLLQHSPNANIFVSPPRYLMDDRYPNPSSSNSTFESSNIPSDFSNTNNSMNRNYQHISVNASQRVVPCNDKVDIEWNAHASEAMDYELDIPTENTKKEKENDLNTYRSRTRRKRNRNRMVIDDDSSTDDGDEREPFIIKTETETTDYLEIKRKRKRIDDDDILDDDSGHINEQHRPLKRFKLSVHKNKNALTLIQKRSGKFAIRSTQNALAPHVQLRAKQRIMKKALLEQEAKHKIKSKPTTEAKTHTKTETKTRNKVTEKEETFAPRNLFDKRESINNITKDNTYRYTNQHKHNLSNVGKRWTSSELEIVWNLHYEKHWSNLQIAEKFQRTECGIMVQIDKMYKDRRANDDLVNKKYLYQKKVECMRMIKGEKKWSQKEHKWKAIHSDEDTDTSSSDDDDEPIGHRMARTHVHIEKKRSNEMWDSRFIHNELGLHDDSIIKKAETKCSTAFCRNIVSKGRHSWKFKFVCCSADSAPCCVGLWRESVTITDNDLSHYIGRYKERAYVFDGYAASKNIYHLDNEFTDDNSYGQSVENGDIISMEVDFNELTLRFSINGVDFDIAHFIDADKYKAAVSVSKTGTTIQLLSYTAYDETPMRTDKRIISTNHDGNYFKSVELTGHL